MKALAQRTSIAALLMAIAMLPACSNNEPPATQPVAQAPAERPAPTPERNVEPQDAGAWNEAETPSDVLDPRRINDEGLLQPVYFDYDQSEIRPSERAKLQANAQLIRENQNFRILIEGHCDERGTREYNMALGERRASAAMQYLVSLGVGRDRIEIISYGEEQPAATGQTESAYQLNRRAQFVALDNGG